MTARCPLPNLRLRLAGAHGNRKPTYRILIALHKRQVREGLNGCACR